MEMGWAIGKASELSGVGIETIRYYEREGITSRPPRTAAGRRDYDAQTISQLRFVKRCRELGFSIPDITELMKLSHSDNPTCQEAGKIGADNLALVREKIVDLKRMERALTELVASCHKGQTDCPMLKELFAD